VVQADAADMVEVLMLLNQLVQRYKEGLGELLEQLLPLAVQRVHALLPTDWDWTGQWALPSNGPASPGVRACRAPPPLPRAALASPPPSTAPGAARPTAPVLHTHEASPPMPPPPLSAPRPAACSGGGAQSEEARERAELQRTYYATLAAVANNGLADALLKAPPGVLDAVMGALARGASAHSDVTIRKTCIQVRAGGGGGCRRGGLASRAGGGGETSSWLARRRPSSACREAPWSGCSGHMRVRHLP
jgi:hypothetical protein